MLLVNQNWVGIWQYCHHSESSKATISLRRNQICLTKTVFHKGKGSGTQNPPGGKNFTLQLISSSPCQSAVDISSFYQKVRGRALQRCGVVPRARVTRGELCRPAMHQCNSVTNGLQQCTPPNPPPIVMFTNLQVQDVYIAVLLVEKQSTWTFWWGIQLNLCIKLPLFTQKYGARN